jgi:hypothetical protein
MSHSGETLSAACALTRDLDACLLASRVVRLLIIILNTRNRLAKLA